MDRAAPAVAAAAADPAATVRPRLGVIVLTFNSASVIEDTLHAALPVADCLHVVDSGSTDGTPGLARALGAKVVQRPFVHYADQRNWAIAEFGAQSDWQLHLDADEMLDATAVAEIRRVLADPGGASGFIFERRTYFLGRALHWGGTTNYHLRLFRSGTARCEDRLYDQHFVSAQPSVRLRGVIHDKNVGNLTEWTARHNRWSDLEAAEVLRPGDARDGQLQAGLSNDPRERRRLYKQGYYRAPLLWRALLLFGYRYVLQGGFLDGRAGFLYAFLQTLWFRMLVDAKLVEHGRHRAVP